MSNAAKFRILTRSSSVIALPKLEPITLPPSQTYCSAFLERHWMRTRGKAHLINFSDEALQRLRGYFDSLDADNKGSLGVEELEDAFIAFGLSESREEVEALIRSVDLDGSGKIEFDEFLEIMLRIKRGGGSGTGNAAMLDFFKRLSNGTLGEFYSKDISFRMNVSQYRRKQMLEAMIRREGRPSTDGSLRILASFTKQVRNNSRLNQQLEESKKSPVYTNGFGKEGRGWA